VTWPSRLHTWSLLAGLGWARELEFPRFALTAGREGMAACQPTAARRASAANEPGGRRRPGGDGKDAGRKGLEDHAAAARHRFVSAVVCVGETHPSERTIVAWRPPGGVWIPKLHAFQLLLSKLIDRFEAVSN
jgi:hypothetical protein